MKPSDEITTLMQNKGHRHVIFYSDAEQAIIDYLDKLYDEGRLSKEVIKANVRKPGPDRRCTCCGKLATQLEPVIFHGDIQFVCADCCRFGGDGITCPNCGKATKQLDICNCGKSNNVKKPCIEKLAAAFQKEEMYLFSAMRQDVSRIINRQDITREILLSEMTLEMETYLNKLLRITDDFIEKLKDET